LPIAPAVLGTVEAIDTNVGPICAPRPHLIVEVQAVTY
jgi:hypothetical protein